MLPWHSVEQGRLVERPDPHSTCMRPSSSAPPPVSRKTCRSRRSAGRFGRRLFQCFRFPDEGAISWNRNLLTDVISGSSPPGSCSRAFCGCSTGGDHPSGTDRSRETPARALRSHPISFAPREACRRGGDFRHGHRRVVPGQAACAVRIISAARSPMMAHGAWVLPVVTRGMIEPSATRSPSIP